MTFHTDRPFYPYREPAASKAPAPSIDPGSRLLRVHFLSTERHAATLAGEPWSARVLFAAPVAPVRELAGLGDQLASLTTFVDESYPRRGIDEVYFAPGADRTEVRQPAEVIVDRVVTTIPLDLILVLGVIAFLTIRHLRRPRRVR